MSSSSPAPGAAGGHGATAASTTTTAGANETLLYHQTLIPTQNVTHAIEGSFTMPDANDLVLIRHNVVELWRLYAEDVTGGIECVCRTPLLSSVYAAVAVPTSASAMTKSQSGAGISAHGSGLDDVGATAHRSGVHYLALTSETGYVTLLRYALAEPPVPTRLSYDAEGEANGERGGATLLVTTSLRGTFVKVSEVCLGRSGARLTVPGARMAVDPAGTALFITALMRSKVLVPLVRNEGWDPVKGANVGQDDEDEASGSEGEEEEGNESEDGAESERRGPMSARERRAARRRRAANARRANGALQFGAPIEVQRQTVLYSLCALDGYMDQAVFAVLEEEVVEAREGGAEPATAAAAGGGTFLRQATTGSGGASAADGNTSGIVHQKHFVLYAYVPSLKQVQRTQLVHLPATAHRLIAVPAAPYGPGGVLVCTDTELVWYDVSASQQLLQQQQQGGSLAGRAGVFKCTYPFPRRMDCAELLYDPSIIHHAITCFGHRFFLVLQDEQGDVYRVFLQAGNVQRAYDALRTRELLQANPEMQLANGGALPPVPNPLAVHYFDTLPPSSAMALFRRGFLFLGNEAGALHELYKIKSDGYTADREYVVKRIRRERVVPQAQAAKPAKAEVVVKKETGSEEQPAEIHKEDRKRPREGGAEAAGAAATAAVDSASAAVKAEPTDPTAVAPSTSPSGMLPPLPRVKAEPPAEGEKEGKSPAAPTMPAPSPGTPFKTPTETRVIKVFQPHRRPQHVAQLQSLPNTPAITSFISHLTSSAALSADADGVVNGADPSAAPLPSSAEQPEIFFNYVGGRGAESVLVQARYGYAAKLEGRHVLPTVFASVLPLASAASMQTLARQQQAAIEAAASSAARASRPGSDGANGLRGSGARQQAQRLKALRQLAATVSGARDQVWTDRVLLCTREGTTVYKIGRTVEQDTHTNFITAERTIAATTLQHGSGYVQVTPRGIHVLSATGGAARHGGEGVVPTSWTHPHGNPVLAAAVTPSTILLSFRQRGGIASFDLGLTGMELQQRDVLPTFPLAPVVALLQPPASAVSAALQRELQGLLWNASSAAASSSGAAATAAAAAAAAAAQTEQLAAIATVNQEVYLVHPRKLREPLEKVTCRRGGATGDGAALSEVSITSLLLTYLGDAEGGDAAAALAGGGGGGGSSSTRSVARGSAAHRRKLLLFVGHSDGMVTRCELNPSSAKVMAKAELWCGARPCQLIPGDGETYCYAVSGDRTWRCEVQEGAVKMTPYSFPTRPNSFARFVLPSRSGMSSTVAGGETSTNAGAAASALAAQEDEEADSTDLSSTVGTITLAPREQQQEVVIAVQNRELALYVSNTGTGGAAGGSGGGGAGGIAYSFRHHPLPLAGRRLLQHPTRPAYLVLCGVEHRSHGRQEAEQHRAEDLALLTARTNAAGPSKSAEEAVALYGGIPYTAPQRSLGRANAYHSMLQLYHQGVQRLLPPIHFEPHEAITSVVIGSFAKEFGREPVVIVGTASMYTHGAGCGSGASWKQGFLRTFRCTSTSGGGASVESAQAGPLRLELLHSTYLRPDSTGEGGSSSSSSRPSLNAEAVAEEARPDYASALCVCEEVGLLFVGMGSAQGLRIYSWGKEQLLRRRHLAHTPGKRINAIDYVFAAPPGSRNGNTHMTSFDAMDLYECPYNDDRAQRLAREKQLLIVCGTVDASIFIAALQPGSAASGGGAAVPSFLLQIATDRVPRWVTSLAVLDERTFAVADRFGTIAFLRMPENTRTQFAQPVSQLKEAELVAEEAYLRTQQTLQEVARHRTGQLVTALRVQRYDPSQGTDPALATSILYYSTSLGSVGAFLPFLREEDGALAAYLQPLLNAHARPLLAPPTMLPPTSFQCHHVVDGDVVQLLLRGGATSTTTPFTAAGKADVEEALERQAEMEGARRRVLGLPKRTLPSLTELVAKQRALLTLPV